MRIAAIADAHFARSRKQRLRWLQLAHLTRSRIAGRGRATLQTLAVFTKLVALRASHTWHDFGLLLQREGTDRRLAESDETALLIQQRSLIKRIQRELLPVSQTPGLRPRGIARERNLICALAR